MSQREDIDYVLERTNLTGCFSAIVSTHDVGMQPDPECIVLGFA